MILGENHRRVCELVFDKMKKELNKGLNGFNEEDLQSAISEAVNIYNDEEMEAFFRMSNEGTSNLCSACGYCCTNYKIQMTLTDLEKMGKEINIIEYVEPLPDNEGRYVFKDTPCKFLQDNNRCGHYNIRPESCKNYPLVNPDGYVRMSRDSNCNYVIRFFLRKSFALLLQKQKEDLENVKK